MSKNRENVIWQSLDGSWNIGFFVAERTNFSEDYDEEWDVDYDYDSFSWVSLGHSSPEAAEHSWSGPNPGGARYSIYAGNEAQNASYDRMAQYFLSPALKEAAVEKENAEKNQIHFTKLKEEFESNIRFAGLRIKVTVADPKTVHTTLGMTTTYTGTLKEKNGWLMLTDWDMEDVPVYNLKEENFADNIHSIRKEVSRGWGNSYGRAYSW